MKKERHNEVSVDVDLGRAGGRRCLRRHPLEPEDELEADHQHPDGVGQRLQQGASQSYRSSDRGAN